VSDIDLDELRSRLDDVVLLDVRTRSEFEGTAGSGCDPRQGHIPGAVHVDVYRLVELGADQIRELLGAPGESEVVAYCHSGSRSAVAVHLLRTLGYDARNYVGSWHEWSRNDELPMEGAALPG
jgi:thiosulfate/3-mercaptopyruvate sulfurtransferase